MQPKLKQLYHILQFGEIISPDLSECDGLWPHSRHRGWRLEDKTQTLDRDMSKYLVFPVNLVSGYTRLLLIPARSLDKFDTPTSHLSNIRTRWKQDLFQTGKKCKQRNIFYICMVVFAFGVVMWRMGTFFKSYKSTCVDNKAIIICIFVAIAKMLMVLCY